LGGQQQRVAVKGSVLNGG